MARKPEKKRTGKRLTPAERVRRHVQDKNDIITEDDLRDLETGTSVPTEPGNEPLPIPDDKNRPKDEDKNHRYTTPWDVLDEE